MSAKSSSHPHRLTELDGIRGIAVVAVVIDHLLAFGLTLPQPDAAVAFWLGNAGVRYFFVLSGFVISRGLVSEFEQRGTISLKAFWLRRAFRILPAFWAYLAVVAVLGASGVIRTDPGSFLHAVSFTANILPVDWFHEHIWSLSVEEQFYLVAPLLALVLLGKKRWLSAGALALTYLGCLFWHRLEHLAFAFVPGARLEFLSMFRFITCGVALGLFLPSVGRLLDKMPGLVVAGLALATALVRDMPTDAYWLKMGLQFSQPLAIAAVIGWIAGNGHRCAWLNRRGFQWSGRRSYSLYLWQQLFLVPAPSLAFATSPLLTVAFVPVIFLVAALSYQWVERPMIDRGRKLSAAAYGEV